MEETGIYEKLLVPILIGIIIFVSDFAIGWLSMISGWIPMIFVLALITGFMAGSIEDGLGAFIAILVIGNIIGAFMLPFLWPAAVPAGGVSVEDIPALFIIAPFYAVHRWLLIIVPGTTPFDAIFGSFLLAPGLYLLSLGFIAIGGRIAEYVRDEPDDTSELQSSGFPGSKIVTSEGMELEETVYGTNSTN